MSFFNSNTFHLVKFYFQVKKMFSLMFRVLILGGKQKTAFNFISDVKKVIYKYKDENN